ncbi:MAG: DUF721 domain-containing protein [Saprospiraceae bacterium]|nr:DUF721 domain-containing protein [Saprospiraceae bacterium]
MSSNEKTLKDILGKFVNSKPIHDKFQQVQLRKIWRETLGSTINQYTTDIRLNKGILTVVISSSPLRQELIYEKEKLLQLLNRAMGCDIVQELRVF